MKISCFILISFSNLTNVIVNKQHRCIIFFIFPVFISIISFCTDTNFSNNFLFSHAANLGFLFQCDIIARLILRGNELLYVFVFFVFVIVFINLFCYQYNIFIFTFIFLYNNLHTCLNGVRSFLWCQGDMFTKQLFYEFIFVVQCSDLHIKIYLRHIINKTPIVTCSMNTTLKILVLQLFS